MTTETMSTLRAATQWMDTLTENGVLDVILIPEVWGKLEQRRLIRSVKAAELDNLTSVQLNRILEITREEKS